jgi:hypothetical protein
VLSSRCDRFVVLLAYLIIFINDDDFHMILSVTIRTSALSHL